MGIKGHRVARLAGKIGAFLDTPSSPIDTHQPCPVARFHERDHRDRISRPGNPCGHACKAPVLAVSDKRSVIASPYLGKRERPLRHIEPSSGKKSCGKHRLHERQRHRMIAGQANEIGRHAIGNPEAAVLFRNERLRNACVGERGPRIGKPFAGLGTTHRLRREQVLEQTRRRIGNDRVNLSHVTLPGPFLP
ncbi:hypothetical protein [uncultured Roseibium sp.]|uniref:hypothetical protein n=1 Tax=uncultured Roseibium sp. TaxID=1936171 RepID=UPI003749DC00